MSTANVTLLPASPPVLADAPVTRPSGGGALVGAANLLPPSGIPTSADLNDSMAAMYSLELVDQGTDERTGVCQVECDRQQQVQVEQQQKQALDRQQSDSGGRGMFSCLWQLIKDSSIDTIEWKVKSFGDEMKRDFSACDNPKFWSDLEEAAKWVALAASAVAAVFTCGAASALVVGIALAMSVGGMIVQKTHCLGKDSEAIGMGLQIAGAVVGAAAGGGGSGQLVATIATCVQASALATSGVAHVEVTHYQADCLDAQADGARAKESMTFLNQLETWAIDTLQEQVKAHGDAVATLGSAIQMNQQGSLIAVVPLSRG